MDTKIIFTALISLAVGVAGTVAFTSAPSQTAGGHAMPDGSMMHGAMNDMMANLEGKTGDAFDKAFLEEMIVHHEGALDMAEVALQNVKHTELKQMAEAIISTQTAEIQQMKDWQEGWYATR